MVSYDFCEAKDYGTALKHLVLSTEWSNIISNYWLTAVDKSESNANIVANEILKNVKQLYDSNNGTICERLQ